MVLVLRVRRNYVLADDGTKDGASSSGPADFGFGDLNPMFTGIVRPHYEPNQSSTRAIKESVIDFLSPNRAKSVGPFKALVLRVEEQDKGKKDPNPNATNSPPGAADPDLVKIKCRIPEIHAGLPIPEKYGNVDGPHQAVIDMYHTFTAQSDSLPQPEPGEIVWVDFVDKEAFAGAMYVRPIAERESLMATITSGLSAAGLFSNCGQLGGSAGLPQTSGGDSQPSQGGDAAVAGLPRTSRKVEPSGENVVVTAKDASKPRDKTMQKWMRGLKSAGIQGSKNWLGRLASNANLEVIIHIPGTTMPEEPTELALFLHGAGSWNKDTLFNTIPASSKKMGDAGRNIIVVFVENKPASTKTSYWQSAGSFATFVQELESSIAGHFGLSSINIVYKSLVAHSLGGRSIARAIQGFETVGLDKLTLADVVGYDGVFEKVGEYFNSATKPLEANILGFQATKGDPEGHAKSLWNSIKNIPGASYIADGAAQTSPADYSPSPGERTLKFQSNNVEHVLTHINYRGWNHKKYGTDSLEWVNPHVGTQGPTAAILPEGFKEWAYTNTGTLHGWYDVNGTLHTDMPEGAPPPDKKEEPTPVDNQPTKSTKNSTTEAPADPPAGPAEAPKPEGWKSWAYKENGDLYGWYDVHGSLHIGIPCQVDGINVRSQYCEQVEQAKLYTESRVKLAARGGAFASLTKSTKGSDNLPLLVSVPTTKKKTIYLHRLAAKRLEAMNKAWVAETGKEIIKVNSGWRTAFCGHDEECYRQHCMQKYGSMKKCRSLKALYSPHETGLAIDFGNHTLKPDSGTNKQQKQSQAFHWLTKNAHKFGITPYIKEAWHWEINMPVTAHTTGEDWVDGENFAVRVKGQGSSGQVSNQAGLTTTQASGTPGAPSCGGAVTTMGTATAGPGFDAAAGGQQTATALRGGTMGSVGSIGRLHVWDIGVKKNIVENCQSIKATDLCLMMNRTPSTGEGKWLSGNWAEKFKEVSKRANAVGIAMHLVIWSKVTPDGIREQAAEVLPLIPSLGIRSMQFDMEGEWNKSSKWEANTAAFKEAWATCPVPITITGLGYIRKAVTPVVQWACTRSPAGAGIPQAYATNKQGANPSTLPAACYKKWSVACGSKIVVGLDVWGGEISPFTIESGMEASINNALGAGAVELAVWSGPWLFKGNKDAEVRREVFSRYGRTTQTAF